MGEETYNEYEFVPCSSLLSYVAICHWLRWESRDCNMWRIMLRAQKSIMGSLCGRLWIFYDGYM